MAQAHTATPISEILTNRRIPKTYEMTLQTHCWAYAAYNRSVISNEQVSGDLKGLVRINKLPFLKQPMPKFRFFLSLLITAALLAYCSQLKL